MPKYVPPVPVNLPEEYLIILKPFIGPVEKRGVHLTSAMGERIQERDAFPPVIIDSKRLFQLESNNEFDATYQEIWFEATRLGV